MVRYFDSNQDTSTKRILALVYLFRVSVETNDNRAVVCAIRIGVPVMVWANAHAGIRRHFGVAQQAEPRHAKTQQQPDALREPTGTLGVGSSAVLGGITMTLKRCIPVLLWRQVAIDGVLSVPSAGFYRAILLQ